MNERRNAIRVDCEIASNFRNLDSSRPGLIEIAVVKNISRSGIRLQFNDFVPIQNRLYVYLALPSRKTIEAQVTPAWIVELPHLRKYEMGVRFNHIEPDDETLIENFQYTLLLEKMPKHSQISKDLNTSADSEYKKTST